MILTMLRDTKGLFLMHEGRRYAGTDLGIEAGATVKVKVCANQHSKHLRVGVDTLVGGDDKPGVIWIRVA